MTWLLIFVQGIDWAAVRLTLALSTGGLCPWLLLRNLELPELLIRVVHEEKEWLDQHPKCWKGQFRRYDAMPSYHRMLLSLWKPI